MVSKKELLSGCKLYLILDAGVCPYDRLLEVLKEAALSGVDIVQLRDKVGSAKDMLDFSRKAITWLRGRIPFIVNDRIDVAKISGASGVHLGQDDLPLGEARKILGPQAIIGTSCQNLVHLRQAFDDRADYVGFGSVYKTQTKPERAPMDLDMLVKAAHYADVKEFPLFAIGGITRDNLEQVTIKGIRRIAVCREILLAKDVPYSVGEIRRLLKPKGMMRE
ncbi:MAG: thiamine phosphate synthase [Candidatus Omnitrophica bacterium]|nr:thiamine phosphate synthase [Candidatus Omnitrophota bacterium]